MSDHSDLLAAARAAVQELVCVGVGHGHTYSAVVVAKLLAAIKEAEKAAWKCRMQPNADPPQDCDWPFCGCDPAANKVLEALQEAGVALTGARPVAPSPDASAAIVATCARLDALLDAVPICEHGLVGALCRTCGP